MHDRPLERTEYGAMNGIGHEHGAHRHQSATQGFCENHDVGRNSKMMRGQKRTGAKHSRLHLVGYQQRSVASTQGLRLAEIMRLRYSNAALGLDRLDEEGGMTLGR